MRLRDQPAQVQAQADAATAAGACAVRAVEGLRELRQKVCCNTGAVIAHAERDSAIGLAAQEKLRWCFAATAAATATAATMPTRVLQQVAQHQAQPHRIGLHRAAGVLQLQSHRRCIGQRHGFSRGHFTCQRDQIDSLGLQRAVAR